jgi:hypothetical protein
VTEPLTGGHADAGRDAEPEPDVESTCDAFAATLCERRWACLPLAFMHGYGFGDSFGTQARCVERVSLACRGWGLLPGSRATTAAIERCAATIASLDCRVSTQTLTREAPTCEFNRGSLDQGTPCELHLQCSSGNCLSSGADVANWECSTPGVDSPAGADPLGAPCASASDCGVNLVCFEGVCGAPALLGEPCNAQAPACAEYAELRCDESGTCAPHPTLQGACGNRAIDNGGFAACETGECVARNDFGLGRCESYADDGAACDPYAGPVCLYPARCMNYLCRVPGF